jgi:hypothetical protein
MVLGARANYMTYLAEMPVELWKILRMNVGKQEER